MAVLKFGSIVTEGSGSLGGQTIQNSFGGSQLRTKPIPHGNPSASQILIRSINQRLQRGWQALTTAQQKVWNDWPVNHGIFNKSGDPHPLSGHSLWMKYNFSWLAAGGTFLPDPSYWPSPILGPEKVINGNFQSADGWSVDAAWNISGGKANYLDTASGQIKRAMNLTVGILYLVQFDISDKAGIIGIRFTPYGGGAAFSFPFNAYRDYATGHNSYQVTCVNSNSPTGVYAHVFYNAFSLDNLSIKQIF